MRNDSRRPVRAPRPLPPGQVLYTPGASGARRMLERLSAKALLFLHQLPSWLVSVGLGALLVAGLAVRGPGGAAALLVLAAVLGWLAALSWPRLPAAGRAGRLVALALLVGLAAFQAAR